MTATVPFAEAMTTFVRLYQQACRDDYRDPRTYTSMYPIYDVIAANRVTLAGEAPERGLTRMVPSRMGRAYISSSSE